MSYRNSNIDILNSKNSFSDFGPMDPNDLKMMHDMRKYFFIKKKTLATNTILEKNKSETGKDPTQSSQSLQALAIAQAAKVDRKLYIGNLPTGITPSTVK